MAKMLETRELWADSLREQGYQTGRQEVAVACFVRMLRYCRKHRDNPTEKERADIKKTMAIITESIQPDQVKELEGFVRQYPKMPAEKLAIRIMQSSEHIYAMYTGS